MRKGKYLDPGCGSGSPTLIEINFQPYHNVFGHLMRVREVGEGVVMVRRLPGLDTGTRAPSRPAKPDKTKGQCQENRAADPHSFHPDPVF
jgi:hypothetical protein